MNKYFAYLFLISIFFVACKQHKKNTISKYSSSDEEEITGLVFNASVYPDTTFKKMLLEERSFGIQLGFKGVIKLDKNDQKKFDLESDSLKKELDTAKIYVLIADSLLSPKKKISGIKIYECGQH